MRQHLVHCYLLLAAATVYAVPLHQPSTSTPATPPSFSISADTTYVRMGETVTVIVDSSGFPLTPEGTTFWPFVGDAQWGAFVTCRIESDPMRPCKLQLPLPYPGQTHIRVAVFAEGRNWGGHVNISDPSLPCDETRGCGFVVGQPLLDGTHVGQGEGTIVAISENELVIDSRFRPLVPPFQQQPQQEVCVDWEPWHTRNNAGPWMGRPGASALPLLGFYSSFHLGVARQHAIWLIEAGVTCILVDWSNNVWGGIPWSARSVGVQQLVNATMVVLQQHATMREIWGFPVPRAIIMIGLQNGPPASPAALADEASFIYDNLYVPLGKSTAFVHLEDKPVLVVLACGLNSVPQVHISDQFTIRFMGTQLQGQPDLARKKGFWSWMDGSLLPIPTMRPNGTVEAMTVTPAYFAGGGWLGRDARGQRRGSTLVTQFAYAASLKPTILLVCQWNEWAGQPDDLGVTAFVDAYNLTFTNDLEPTSWTECGGYEHKQDLEQLPVCNDGWGFFDLNLLASAIQSYHYSTSSSSQTKKIPTTLIISDPINQFTDGGFDFSSHPILPLATRSKVPVAWAVMNGGSQSSSFSITLNNDPTPFLTTTKTSVVLDLSSKIHLAGDMANITITAMEDDAFSTTPLIRDNFVTNAQPFTPADSILIEFR